MDNTHRYSFLIYGNGIRMLKWGGTKKINKNKEHWRDAHFIHEVRRGRCSNIKKQVNGAAKGEPRCVNCFSGYNVKEHVVINGWGKLYKGTHLYFWLGKDTFS